jgi:hypothetical protein
MWSTCILKQTKWSVPKKLKEKTVLLPLCLPRISHQVTWDFCWLLYWDLCGEKPVSYCLTCSTDLMLNTANIFFQFNKHKVLLTCNVSTVLSGCGLQKSRGLFTDSHIRSAEVQFTCSWSKEAIAEEGTLDKALLEHHWSKITQQCTAE